MAFLIARPRTASNRIYPRTVFRVWISGGYGKGYPVQFYQGIKRDGSLNPLGWNKVTPSAKLNRRGYRAFQYRKTMGLSNEESITLSRSQETSECEICGSPREIAADHNHATSKFRGFLCHRCNTAIGMLQDSPDLLRKAADYLERKG